MLQDSRSYEIRIRPFNRGLTGLFSFLLLRAGMWLLLAGSVRWRNRSVCIVDGRRVFTRCTLPALDAPNTITASPWIWLSLETSKGPGKRPLVSSGPVKGGNGTWQIRSTSVFSGQGPVAVS